MCVASDIIIQDTKAATALLVATHTGEPEIRSNATVTSILSSVNVNENYSQCPTIRFFLHAVAVGGNYSGAT